MGYIVDTIGNCTEEDNQLSISVSVMIEKKVLRASMNSLGIYEITGSRKLTL